MEILHAIRERTKLRVSPDYVVRDYLHPTDFFNLISVLLSVPFANTSVDCYSRAPIDKPNLLIDMQENFGVRYEITEAATGVNATGDKPYYYSLNKRAADFGYQPSLTSLEGILCEANAIQLQNSLQVGGS